jgi:HD-GYP domain-containing protein (c-di-GMP phosphodiesterase class II)
LWISISRPDAPVVPGRITLAEFQRIAEAFAAKHLDDYVIAIKRRGRNPGRKEINDPLWGTIGLTGPEVAVIDSPLLQRLRLIRQLGVAHWVYPGALHTRFEHTLGVLRQVQYLCEAINNLGAQQNMRDLIDPNKVNLLRLAALLHDVGHAAFSHVSEHAIDTLDALTSLPSEFARGPR